MRGLVLKVIGRVHAGRTKREEIALRTPLDAYYPGILRAFAEIERVTGTRGLYVAKCSEVLELLETHRPRSVMELGSGRTSVLFATYAKKNGAKYLAYEQDPWWIDLMNRVIDHLCKSRPVEHSEIEKLREGGRFCREIPSDADFIYVDAPFVPGKSFPTFTGKAAYLDVPRHLATGHRPKVIAVDGRTDSVDAIRKFHGYAFSGSLDWARERGVLSHALRPMRHSVFVAR